MSIRAMHHVAYKCRDAEETRHSGLPQDRRRAAQAESLSASFSQEHFGSRE